MYIETVPNRTSPPAILLRESFREGKKTHKRTLANLSKWDPKLIEGLRILLKGGTAVPDPAESFEIVRSLPHGHVAAVLGMIHQLGLDKRIDGKPSPERDRVLALIAARILAPGSKLGTARGLAEETAAHSLGEELGVNDGDENALYAAMDWLVERQERIEQRLAKRHLKDGSLVLYDLTSVYLEGRRCPLAKRGYSRDGKRGKVQIEFGLLCDADGCPVAVEVFSGNTADPMTVGSQIRKLQECFGLNRVVLVGDRGMLTEARIREEVKPAGLDWISALRGPALRSLVESGAIQMTLFDEQDLVEVESDAWPGERLMVCRNPLLAGEAALDGLYVIRTNLPQETMDAESTVRAYKSLNRVERAFRSLKTVDLKVRPVFHYRANRVRAHVLLCMLAYYVEWHMRQRLKPLLFDEDAPDIVVRKSVVAPVQGSKSARDKASTKTNADGWPVHSFQSLLQDLATVVKNRMVPDIPGAKPFETLTRPTELQRHAFQLLGVKLKYTQ